MNKKIIFGILLAAVVALIVVYRIYNKPHKDIASASVDFEIQLSVLIDEFEADSEAARQKYADKVIMVEGIMQDLQEGEQYHLFLSDGEMGIANCELLENRNDFFSAGQNIKIKGLFVGYDDLIEPTVQLKKCSILE